MNLLDLLNLLTLLAGMNLLDLLNLLTLLAGMNLLDLLNLLTLLGRAEVGLGSRWSAASGQRASGGLLELRHAVEGNEHCADGRALFVAWGVEIAAAGGEEAVPPAHRP